jgi:hypothetical protein
MPPTIDERDVGGIEAPQGDTGAPKRNRPVPLLPEAAADLALR